MLKHYFKLTKPGIILGNLMTATSGFVLASHPPFDPQLLFLTLLGLALVIASACVLNNYFDRHADEKMARTRMRPLPKKTISERAALVFSMLLGIAGFLVLIQFTNLSTTLVTLAGYLIYVVLYTIWKYRSFCATHIGSLAGAVPPLAGYLSASNHFDLGAILLFLIVALWQIPHFFSIAVLHKDEYASASIPVLPIVKGIYATKRQMLLYILLFMAISSSLFFFGYTGYAYLAILLLFGSVWLGLCIQGFKALNDQRWAHQMLRCSLATILALSVTISCSL